MNTKTTARTLSTAAAAAFAFVALAGPASATMLDDPAGSPAPSSTSTSTAGGGFDLGQVALGAMGGLVLAGGGLASVKGVRRHQAHLAH